MILVRGTSTRAYQALYKYSASGTTSHDRELKGRYSNSDTSDDQSLMQQPEAMSTVGLCMSAIGLTDRYTPKVGTMCYRVQHKVLYCEFGI